MYAPENTWPSYDGGAEDNLKSFAQFMYVGSYVMYWQLQEKLQGRKADVVVSDMAPNLSGVESADAARVAHLIELAIEFSLQHLKPEGALVTKVFHGSGYSQLVKLFKETFQVVKPVKPKASRDKSSETFIVGMRLKAPLQD